MTSSSTTRFRSVRVSLRDLLGASYVKAVCASRAKLTGEKVAELKALAAEKVDLYPQAMHERLTALLPSVGQPFGEGLTRSARGAATAEFHASTHVEAAPLGGFGYYRVGEDGRLYLISKSEHYHVSLGHSFPGYRLVGIAKGLGIPNATHNNTRGHITRTLEEELIRLAAGLRRADRVGLSRVVASRSRDVINRVLNLETGSLAAEAAIKMVLARFYRVQGDSPPPRYEGRTPVIVVVGDTSGGLQGNYHGTAVLGQMLRGMWPQLLDQLQAKGLLLVRAIRPNSIEDLERIVKEYDHGRFKVAGFFHELVMMNYAAARLTDRFVRRAYRLCRQHDIPTAVDEIQTCAWSPQVYMYREYGVKPSIVVVGKGFSGGEYAASRVLSNAEMDRLPQFGALITNGQEELASLAYLVTIRWVEANAAVTERVGEYYEERLRELGDAYRQHIDRIDGRRHLSAISFHEIGPAKAFARHLNRAGLDISVQSYKANCPPSALTKLPLTVGYETIDVVIEKMHSAMASIDTGGDCPMTDRANPSKSGAVR